jgi:hypothetical protein
MRARFDASRCAARIAAADAELGSGSRLEPHTDDDETDEDDAAARRGQR